MTFEQMNGDFITWSVIFLLLLLLSSSHALKLQQQTSATSTAVSATTFDFDDDNSFDNSSSGDSSFDDSSFDSSSFDDSSFDDSSSDDTSTSSVRLTSQLHPTIRSRRSAEPNINDRATVSEAEEQRAALLPGFPDPATVQQVVEKLQKVGEKVIPLLLQGNAIGGSKSRRFLNKFKNDIATFSDRDIY